MFLTCFVVLGVAVSPTDFQAHIDTLAADSMEGRGLGTQGIERAARYIAGQMAVAGLEPAGDMGKAGATQGWFQEFEMTTGVALAASGNLLTLTNPMESGNLSVGDDFAPFGLSGAGAFEGPVAFLGYGLHAPEFGYDDFAGVNLEGHVAVAFRYEPRESDADSPLEGSRPTYASDVRYKAREARKAGAVALILVDGPLAGDEDRLPGLRADGAASDVGIPVLGLRRTLAGQWFSGAGLDLRSEQEAIEESLTPRSRRVPGLSASGAIALDRVRTRTVNVLGRTRGRGALAHETVVLGAHYDHLGRGAPGSMRPDSGEIHNGADDNASGVSAILLAARTLAPQDSAPGDRRQVLFIAFSAEESGLGGSGHYVAHPTLPLETTVAMVNLDMVGRLREQGLSVLGVETAEDWNSRLDAVASDTRFSELKLVRSGDGYGPSDQTSFYARDVPVLHLFTGAHLEYHTPADDPETINAEGGALVTDFVTAVVEALSTSATAPSYVRASAAPQMSGDSRGYGSYLGTIPDYSTMERAEGGVLLADVRPGGPADVAGLKGGDQIVEMAAEEIRNLYDMTYVLREHRPGEVIAIVVQRGDERVGLQATLGRRGESPEKASLTEGAASTGHGENPHSEFGHGGNPHAAHHGDGVKPGGGSGDESEASERSPEVRITNIRQLTFGGENAEGYFSPDGTRLVYQATPRASQAVDGCDQIYEYDLMTGVSTLLSSGLGRTTCAYYDWPEGERFIYASTHAGSPECPPVPDFSQGYVWPIYPDYDLYIRGLDSREEPRAFAPSSGYDAEATWCHGGGRVVFTSTRDGDLELYSANEEGGDVKRLTHTPGYDGGAFFSPDCRELVFRASRPRGQALLDYEALLRDGKVRPSAMELFVMSAEGGEPEQVTHHGGASFAPYWHPDGERILFSSNLADSAGREFELYMIGRDGEGLEAITHSDGFDGFPMFSPNGRYLVFASNRGAERRGETNLFIAEWVESPESKAH